MSTPVLNCVACGSNELEPFLNLGNQSLANDFHDVSGGFERFPLKVARCKQCTHCQLMESVEPRRMFSRYSYVSGTTQTLREYFHEFAKSAVQKARDQLSIPCVLDIACNDGTLLESFRGLGCDVCGVDPAENLRAITSGKGLRVHVGFWNLELAEELGQFDIVTAFNVLAHTAHPLDFMIACRESMSRHARLYVQTSQCSWLELEQFDCVYHEHFSYFSEESFRTLARRAGFVIESLAITPIHGGSFLACLHSPYRDMVLTVDRFKSESLQTVDRLAREGWTICGYGAAAKGSVVLQTVNLKLEWVADDNPLKVGKFMPGTKIQIVENARVAIPDRLAIVLLAWNFADEIKRRVASCRAGKPTCFVTLPGNVEVCV